MNAIPPPGMLELLQTKGVVVCLHASIETILARTARQRNRPLLEVEDPEARNATSGFARMEPGIVDRIVAALGRDLADGAWAARHGHLRALAEHDVGLRLVIARPA